MTSTVLVTGGTGFVGVRCVLQLLEKGYNVKTIMPSPKRKAALFSPTAKNIVPQLGR
jgi:uncharacterized protein YbjT (DUF2867 family)